MIAACLLSTSVFVAIPAFSAQPPIDKSTYYVGAVDQPSRLDPARAYDTASGELIQNVYEPLIWYGDKHPVTFTPGVGHNLTSSEISDLSVYVPVIATQVPNDTNGGIIRNYTGVGDELWTFTLNTNAQFPSWTAANGTVMPAHNVTVADVVYSFQRQLVYDSDASPDWMWIGTAFNPGWVTFSSAFSDYANGTFVNTANETAVANLITSWVYASGGNNVAFHFLHAYPDVAMYQIFAQTWGSILEKSWVIEHGGWTGTFYAGWSNDYRRKPSNSYSELDKYKDPAVYGAAHGSKYTTGTHDVPDMLGTGPYLFTSWDNTISTWRIDYNSNYWKGWTSAGDKAGNYIKTVIETGVAAWPTRKMLFLTGDFDVAVVPRANMYDVLTSTYNPIAGVNLVYNIASLSNDVMLFGMNISSASPYQPYIGYPTHKTGPEAYFFNNTHLRRAFSWALNYTSYLKDAWFGEAILQRSWWVDGLPPQSYKNTNSSMPQRNIDLTQMQNELNLAVIDGFNVGAEGFEITLAYNIGNGQRLIAANLIAQAFLTLGSKYKVNVVGLDWPVFLDAQNSGYLPMYGVGWLADFADPDNFCEPYQASWGAFMVSQGPPFPEDQAFVDTEIQAAMIEQDPAKRGAMYLDLQYRYWLDSPSFTLIQPVGRRFARDWVQGWYYNPLLPGLYAYDLYKSAPVDQWPMFHHDLTHTGYSTSTAPTTNQTLWNYTTGSWVGSSPAVVGGIVYVGSGDQNVYALNAATGAQIWKYTTGDFVYSSPVVADGKVYIGSGDEYGGLGNGAIYCLDASSGAFIWRYAAPPWVESSPVVAGGVVFVGSGNGNVYALNASNGAFIWNYLTGGSVESSPVVAGGVVFVGSRDGNVYALNAATGAQIWKYTTGGGVDSSPAVVGGVVFVGSDDHKVYALNASNSALIWSYLTGGSVFSSPAVAGGVVYVGSEDHKVYALNAATGAFIWSYTTGNWVLSSPGVADGKVYVGSWDWKVYCLDASTGAFIWSYITIASTIDGSPAIVDDIVYIGGDDHNVYAFGPTQSSTAVVCSPNPVSVGWSANCTATVSGSNPTGTVTWSMSSSTGSFSQSVCNLSTGSCLTTYTDNFPGSVTIAASYSGDSNNVPSSGSTILTVTSGGPVYYSENYTSVQAAIDAAPLGATVIIAPGFYSESLTVNKTLTIIGEKDPPIFSGGGSGVCITLLSGASGSIVTGIVITIFKMGISVVNAGDCGIYCNIFDSLGDCGIVVEGSDATNNAIYNNLFQDTPTPIKLTTSTVGNTVYGNMINSQATVTLNVGATGNKVYKNVISGNQIVLNMANSEENVIYHNNFLATVQITVLATGNNVWDDGYPSGGNYWSTYAGVDEKGGPYQNVTGSDGIGDTPYVIASNSVDRYPLMKPWTAAAGHSVAVISVMTAKRRIGQGFSCNVTVVVADDGEYAETFNITCYANDKALGTQQVNNLHATCPLTLTFTWNTMGFAKGNYTLSAYAWPVPGETNMANNNFTGGAISVTIPGDVNGDFTVDIYDAITLAGAYNSGPTSPNWNSNADINSDNIVDIYDAIILANHYNQHYP